LVKRKHRSYEQIRSAITLRLLLFASLSMGKTACKMNLLR
jgi:hypothetical protein